MTNDNSTIPPTEKVLKDTKNIIRLLEPLKPFDVNQHEDDLKNNFYPKPKVWLHDIYTFVHENNDDEAMDLMFDKIGDLLEYDQFEEVNNILRIIDLHKLNINLFVGLMSITKAGNWPSCYDDSSKLPYRDTLILEIEKIISETETPDRVEKLMIGLRK